ncbi:hypothetical protein TNCV_2651371 [Trichonephila clavipes]|nr:hypothetical protein TNCV_2651371 [Trichonephila clavipes]
MFHMGNRPEEHAGQGNSRIPSVSRTRMTILHASRPHALSLVPPDTDTFIRILHVKPGTGWKDDLVPLLYPFLSSGTPHLYAAASKEEMVPVQTVIYYSRCPLHFLCSRYL